MTPEDEDSSSKERAETPLEVPEVNAASSRDSVWNRIRHGGHRVPATLDPALRRMQGIELLIVLAIFPLGSSYVAVADLIQRIQTGYPVTSHALPPIQGAWLDITLGSIVEFIQLGAVFLVWYLLIRSGERLGALNLGQRRWRMDLAMLLPIFIVVQWLPILAGSHIVSATGLQGYFLAPSPVPLPLNALTIFQVIQGAVAGVLEEIVVLGYLVRRLQQRGYNVATIVAIDVLVRVSYHLYYGWNVIPIACWAVVSVLIYLRTRRLLPFIICHFLYDAAFPFRAFYHGAYDQMKIVAIVSGLIFLCFWIRWNPTEAGTSSFDKPDSGTPRFPTPIPPHIT